MWSAIAQGTGFFCTILYWSTLLYVHTVLQSKGSCKISQTLTILFRIMHYEFLSSNLCLNSVFSLVLEIVMLHQLRHLKQVALKKVIFSVADGPIFATLPVGMLSKLIKMMFLGGFIFHIGNERGTKFCRKTLWQS